MFARMLAFALLLVVDSAEAASPEAAAEITVDVVVVGAMPGGIAAAVAAARLGERVALIEYELLVRGQRGGAGLSPDARRRGTSAPTPPAPTALPRRRGERKAGLPRHRRPAAARTADSLGGPGVHRRDAKGDRELQLAQLATLVYRAFERVRIANP